MPKEFGRFSAPTNILWSRLQGLGLVEVLIRYYRGCHSRRSAAKAPTKMCKCRNWKGAYLSLIRMKRKKFLQRIRRLFLLTKSFAEMAYQSTSVKLEGQLVFREKVNTPVHAKRQGCPTWKLKAITHKPLPHLLT